MAAAHVITISFSICALEASCDSNASFNSGLIQQNNYNEKKCFPSFKKKVPRLPEERGNKKVVLLSRNHGKHRHAFQFMCNVCFFLIIDCLFYHCPLRRTFFDWPLEIEDLCRVLRVIKVFSRSLRLSLSTVVMRTKGVPPLGWLYVPFLLLTKQFLIVWPSRITWDSHYS